MCSFAHEPWAVPHDLGNSYGLRQSKARWHNSKWASKGDDYANMIHLLPPTANHLKRCIAGTLGRTIQFHFQFSSAQPGFGSGGEPHSSVLEVCPRRALAADFPRKASHRSTIAYCRWTNPGRWMKPRPEMNTGWRSPPTNCSVVVSWFSRWEQCFELPEKPGPSSPNMFDSLR